MKNEPTGIHLDEYRLKRRPDAVTKTASSTLTGEWPLNAGMPPWLFSIDFVLSA
jgi:hypothetical protein